MSAKAKAGIIMASMIFLWWLTCTGVTIYGLYLVFSASLVLGIVSLFLPFLWPLTALLAVFTDVNLPQKILDFVK